MLTLHSYCLPWTWGEESVNTLLCCNIIHSSTPRHRSLPFDYVLFSSNTFFTLPDCYLFFEWNERALHTSPILLLLTLIFRGAEPSCYKLMGGALWFNGWGTYDKVSCCFVWKYAQKILVFRGVPFPIIAWPQVVVPFNSRLTCGLLQREWYHSPPKACFYLRSPAFGWLSQCYEYTAAKTK